MAEPKKDKFVFKTVAEEEKFSKLAVYILSGWTIGTVRTRIFKIYVGSTTTGSKVRQYGKGKEKLKNVANLKRTDLHRFSKKDWLPSEYLKLNPEKKLFTTAALRLSETHTIEATEEWRREHLDIKIELVNIRKPHAGCSKCRYTACPECCGVKLPTELPSIGKKAKKFLDAFFRLLTCN